MQTKIHMGAGKFTATHTEDNGESTTLDLRKASDRDLGKVARAICEAHGLKGPQAPVRGPRAQRKPTPKVPTNRTAKSHVARQMEVMV